jgi:hypothetical protein
MISTRPPLSTIEPEALPYMYSIPAFETVVLILSPESFWAPPLSIVELVADPPLAIY